MTDYCWEVGWTLHLCMQCEELPALENASFSCMREAELEQLRETEMQGILEAAHETWRVSLGADIKRVPYCGPEKHHRAAKK